MEDQAHDPSGIAAKRHPDPDLARALADLMGQHAVDAHRCQQQGDDPERERQQHRCPPRVERLPDALGHREDIVRLQLGIECRERGPDRAGHVGGIAAAPDGEADVALSVLHVHGK